MSSNFIKHINCWNIQLNKHKMQRVNKNSIEHKMQSYSYLVDTISNELKVGSLGRYGTFWTLTIESRTWIVLGGSYNQNIIRHMTIYKYRRRTKRPIQTISKYRRTKRTMEQNIQTLHENNTVIISRIHLKQLLTLWRNFALYLSDGCERVPHCKYIECWMRTSLIL